MAGNKSKRLPLLVAGILFLLVALLHVYRVIYHIEIMVSGHVVPMSVSYVGIFVAFILSLWFFKSSNN